MDDFPVEGEQESVAVDTADGDFQEDQFFDTLEEAAAALGDDDEGAEPEAPEDPAEDGDDPGAVKVTLADGTEVSLGEIEKGYMRQADYTRKTTEVAQEREALKSSEAALSEQARFIEAATQKLLHRVQQLIPQRPDAALAHENPAEYVRRLSMHETARQELAGWMADGDEAGQVVQQFTAQQVAQRRAEADAELAKVMPSLKDPAALAKFDADVKATAIQFGFDDATIAATTDPRIRRAMYYAAIGMRAEENRKAAARRAGAPKALAPPSPAKPVNVNQKAMRRLSQTGSFKDAMQIDF